MDPLRGDDAAVDAGETTVATRGRELGDCSVEAALHAFSRPVIAWAAGGERVAGGGAAATLTADGADRFGAIRRAAATLFAERSVPPSLPAAARPRLFGGFAFHERGGTDGDGPWDGFPDAQFVLPEIQVVRADPEAPVWLVANATGPNAAATAEARLDRWTDRLDALEPAADADKPGIESKTLTPDAAGWREQVTAAVDRIERGSLRKVVLASALTADLAGELSIPNAYSRLGGSYPECYRFIVEPENGPCFFGATPERLVTRRGRTVETEALAGSIGRGDSQAEDERLARELRASEKVDVEHELVVEAIANQLEPYAAEIAARDRTVKRLATIQHLQTPMSAELAEDYHVLSLVEALHPTPAVGGLPPEAALETIRETEAFDRGWYASPVGWFDADGDGTFAVALRSAVATDRRATLFGGNGIVADSDPDREWDEVQLKFKPILDVLE